MNVCLFVRLCVCLYLIQNHISEPIGTKLCTRLPLGFSRDRKVCMGPKFLISSTFWALFSLGDTAESWTQDGCRRNRFSRYPYIRGSSWCSRDVTDITLSLTEDSSAAALCPWF